MSEPFVGVDEWPRERNGRPVHDQNPPELGGTHPCWQDAYSVQLHHEHADSICRQCGCCWGCDEDCCAQYETSCPNPDCGCSRETQLDNQRFDDEQRRKATIHVTACGVPFPHDSHGYLDDDGRTRVCDEVVLTLVRSPIIWVPALTGLLLLSAVSVRVGSTTNRKR